MPGVSAIIITKNEEQNIAGAIESLLWADEILVVDSFSTDNTITIANQYPVTVLQHPFDNFSRQRNWALEQASQPWVLMLDADERIPENLKQEIVLTIKQSSPLATAYKIYRENYFMGERVRFSGWQNDAVTRLFNKSLCRYSDKNVHEELMVTGNTARLKHKMQHFTYRNLQHYLEKWEQYSWLSARDKAKHTSEITLFHLAIKPLVRFLKQYILKLGILDGRVGFTIACLAAGSVFMRYLKIWRMKEENLQIT